ncbi:MAG: alkaline phosphatase D family protein [Pseudomonadota bacterium]
MSTKSYHRGARPDALGLGLCLLMLAGLGGLSVGLFQIGRDAGANVAPTDAWLPLDRRRPLTRIGFGSCLHQRKPQPIWAGVRARRPDLFIMMGDNVYGDIRPPAMTKLIEAYRRQARQPELRDARAAFPFLATWDDHDYGRNDAGGDFPQRDQARALFRQFWQAAAPRGPNEDGIYAARTVGPKGQRVQIILLDTRSYRARLKRPTAAQKATYKARGERWPSYLPDPTPSKSMLGAAQWTWLTRTLKEPADLRIIVSSIQVLATSHGWERWDTLPAERAKLLFMLKAAASTTPTLILSGDRHRAGFYRDGKLLEATSSSLNYSFKGQDPPDPTRQGQLYGRDNFGLVDIDWAGGKANVSINDVNGKPVKAQTLSLTR